VVVLAFLRLSTSPKVLCSPLSPSESARCVERWFDCTAVSLLNPGHDHLRIFLDLVSTAGIAGNLTTDAQIAALALEHRAEVHSSDHDFARFPGLRWRNPLAG
jgi:toxin-antitoxin system PIN domain toxin